MSKKLLVLMMASFLLLGLLAPVTVMAEETRDDLILAGTQDPDNLDPRLTTSEYSREVMELVYNSLVYLNEDLEIEYDLAEDLETPDDTTYIFHLRDDVTWHDGEPFTAEDVVFTYEAIADEEFGSPHRDRTWFDTVEALDDYTVKFTTEEPNAATLTGLRRFIAPAHLAPEESYEEEPGTFAYEPVGTGPYTLEEWVPDDYIRLERNEDYFEGPANLETIIRRVIPEDETRYTELLAGEVDMAEPPEREIDALDQNDDFTVESSETLNYFPVAINHDYDGHDKLDDVRVRQALNYAIDKETIVNHIWPTATVMHSPIVPDTWAHDPEAIYQYEYNPEKAEELLAEAGYEDGITLSLVMSDATDNVEFGEIIRHYYEEAGINLEVNTMEFSSALSQILDGDFQLYFMGSTGMYDPHDFMNRFTHGEGTTAYDNEEFNELVDEAVTIVDDQDKRAELYSEAQRIMTEDAYNVPLYNSQVTMAWNADFDFNYNYIERYRNLPEASWSE